MKITSFKDYINETSEITETLIIKDNKLIFDYSSKEGDFKTSFGKNKTLKPYKKADSVLDGKTVYSAYQAKGSDSTEIIRALKSKNNVEVSPEDYEKFINRTAIYLSSIIKKEKTDVIITPQSSSPLVDDITNKIKEKIQGVNVLNGYFAKVDVEDIKNITIVDDPKVTPKIRKGLESLLRSAVKNKYFAMVKINPPFRKFLRGFFNTIDDNIVKNVKDKKVVIIDDVISSGTTISEIMRVVGGAGALDVYGITIFKS